MKYVTVCNALTVVLLLVTGTAAIADAKPDVADSHAPISVGFEFNSMSTKYALDASTGDPMNAFWENSSTKLSMDEALIRIGYKISPAFEFHGILGAAKPKSGEFFLLGSKNGLLFGAGMSASPPSNTPWKSNFGLEITHANVKDSQGTQELSGYVLVESFDGVISLPFNGIATGSAELQLTKVDLSARIVYEIGFTEPYIGSMYSIARGTFETKLQGHTLFYCPSASEPCFQMQAVPLTPDGKQNISLDSHMGLTLGFNAHVADAMNIGFGAIFGSRTQYSAHVEYSF